MMLSRNHAVIFQKLPLSLFSQANAMCTTAYLYTRIHVQKSTQSLKNRAHTITNSVSMFCGCEYAPKTHTHTCYGYYMYNWNRFLSHTQYTYTHDRTAKMKMWYLNYTKQTCSVFPSISQSLRFVFLLICLFKFYTCNILRKIDHLHT